MADKFGCDVGAVERTAGQLGTVANEMRTFGRRREEFAGALRSSRILEAIRCFEEDSSDHRDEVLETIDGLKRVLDGLVEGCRTLDEALLSGLTEFDKSTSGLLKGPTAAVGASE
jgi:hypothetical protein